MRTEEQIAKQTLQAAIECVCPDCKKRVPSELARRGKWVHKLAGGRTRDCKASERMVYKMNPDKLVEFTGIKKPIDPASSIFDLEHYLGTRTLIPSKKQLFNDLYQGNFTHDMMVKEIKTDFDYKSLQPTYTVTIETPNGFVREYKDMLLSTDQKNLLEQHIRSVAQMNMLSPQRFATLGGLKPSLFAEREEPCEACHGNGQIEGEECWHCEGTGVDPVKK